MAAKRIRCQNFSYAEKCVLVELVSRYKNIVENKKTDNATMKEKETVWIKISAIFNASTTSNRNVESIKNLWDNLKKKARKTLSENSSINYKSPGEGTPELITDVLLGRVRDIIKAAVDGPVENSLDCDDILKIAEPKIEPVGEGEEGELTDLSKFIHINVPGREIPNWVSWSPQQKNASPINGENGHEESPGPSEVIKLPAPPRRFPWRGGIRRPRVPPKSASDRLIEAKLELALIAKEQAEDENRMRRELFDIRKEQELALLEINKLELRRKQLLFEQEFGEL